MNHDPYYYPFSSRRMVTYGTHGMVATSQALASQAGMEILKQGGNAVDAAIATAAMLTVVEPTSNGLGSDAFAIVWMNGELHGLNASGPSPHDISRNDVVDAGHDQMPEHGWIPVTVPGAPAGWAALSQRFGRLPFKTLLQPAIQTAEQGYVVTPTVSQMWQEAYELYRRYDDPVFDEWFKVFCPEGHAPRPGDIWKSGDHAKTLALIADTMAQDFYSGQTAERIASSAKQSGGYLTGIDLAQYAPEWVEPVKVSYRGYEVWEIPPNGAGLVALMALNTLNHYEDTHDEVETLHRKIEATKLAYVDGFQYISDKAYMSTDVNALLAASYADERRAEIGEHALTPTPGDPVKSGTVYLATADGEGNMVSFIQSNFMNFGSGVVVPGTGISLQNRGASFSLDPEHVNVLAPGKKTYHTIIPGFLTYQGRAIGPFGVMGGFMQPQGHVQVITAMLDDKLNPQATLDAPRWRWVGGKTVEVEPGFPDYLAQALVRRGHDIIRATDSMLFGRGQIILRDPDTGVLCAGTEPRTDGSVAAW